jgi:virulence-associated protein VagC
MSAKPRKAKPTAPPSGINYLTEARKARTFRTGGSTAVRIPKDFQLHDEDLLITRLEDSLVITRAPAVRSVADWWSSWDADPGFMADGRQQPAMQSRDFGV